MSVARAAATAERDFRQLGSASALPHQQIGPYRILRVIGAGGMGTVYEGLQPGIERRVAIKVLHPDLAGRPDAQARLYREARAVNRVGHPGLVEISEVEPLPDGSLYLVMELLRGETLSARLQRLGGMLPISNAVEVTAALVDILSAAHRHDVIHRDLKPSNVMVVPDSQMPSGERVKLIDFGIAKLVSAALPSQDKTPQDTVLGTPDYMSPEQCAGEANIDGTSDVYALGALLFHLLAGRPPFVAKTPRLVMAKHQLESPIPLHRLRPQVPKELANLVAEMLAKLPAERPALDRVLSILRSIGHSSATITAAKPETAAMIESPLAQSTQADVAAPRPGRTSWRLLPAALILLGAIMGTGWLAMSFSALIRTRAPLQPPPSGQGKVPSISGSPVSPPPAPAAVPVDKPPAPVPVKKKLRRQFRPLTDEELHDLHKLPSLS